MQFSLPFPLNFSLIIMKRYYLILADLEGKINRINSDSNDVFAEIELSVYSSKAALNQLRLEFLARTNLSPSQESYFFKNIKPVPLGYMIYFLNLGEFETKRPQNTRKRVKQYIQDHLSYYQDYYIEHKDFYQYLERNRTHRDNEYFIRNQGQLKFHPDALPYFMDKDFSTSHDYIVAKIFAHKLLIARLTKELETLEDPTSIPGKSLSKKLRWTGPKVDLIELLYGLHASGTINNGQTDIKELASIFQHFLNIDLGEYYRTYKEIRSRKTNPTKFLDRMIQFLQSRMAQADE